MFVCKLLFLSKISQERLHLGFCNLVQMLGMTCYIVCCVKENQPPFIFPLICSLYPQLRRSGQGILVSGCASVHSSRTVHAEF